MSNSLDCLRDEMAWTDEQLVRACLKGSESAWCALVDKYKRLIFSVPIKFGLEFDSATEVFQDVCLTLLSELPTLREPKALPAWLMRTAWHKSIRWKRTQGRYVELEPALSSELTADSQSMPEEVAQEIESEQALYEVIAELSPRCHKLIRMLFFETPPAPYEKIAQSFGLAIGSIGFVRLRCLKQLRKRLSERGFR